MYAILDIESTGGQAGEEGIMEIAIYRYDGHEVTDRFASLINPERPIDPYVTKLTGINNKMLRNAPKFYEVAKRILEITSDAVMVAHNAHFDYRMLKQEFDRLGYNFKIETLCTVELSQKLLPDQESHSLGKLVRSLGIPISDRHRADGDALATVKLFKLLLEKDTGLEIIKSSLKYIKIKQVEADLRKILKTLPTSTGIFYLYDHQDELLLIGKARNIRKQVNKLFLSTSQRAKRITKATVRAQYLKTGNELIAAIKERTEVEKHQPRFNTKRKSFRQYYLLVDRDYKLSIHQQLNDIQKVLTAFSSYKSASDYLKRLQQQLEGLTVAKKKERLEELLQKISIENQSFMLRLRGRAVGENSFVIVNDGKLIGYAYSELQMQASDPDILQNLMVRLTPSAQLNQTLYSYLRTSRGVQKIPLELATTNQ